MTVTTSTRFWTSLEDLRGNAGVMASWRACLGDELPRVHRLLRATSQRAFAYPKLNSHRCPAPYDVVTYADNDHEGVCPRTGEIIALSIQDILVYEVDRRTLRREIARAIGCSGQDEPVLGAERTYRLGVWHDVPVYLSVQHETADLERVAMQLCTELAGPFLLLTPTYQFRSQQLDRVLKRAGACWLGLQEAFDVSGAVTLTEAGNRRLREFHRLLTGQSDEPQFVFRRQDDAWLARYDGVTKLLKPLTGHTYVARLLAQPQQEFHVAALLASVADDERVLADNTAAEVVDHQAVQAYRREIEDLQEELGLAQKYHDLGRQEALEQQLDALVCELARVTGLGGKRRQVGRADQIRKSVCNAIERSLTYIEERHAALASHLRATLELGYKPVYRPAQSVEWQT